MSDKTQIVIDDVIDMIRVQGKTREEVAMHYGITRVVNGETVPHKTMLKELFQHPRLKGLKRVTSTAASFSSKFEIVDGSSDAANEAPANESNEAETETPATETPVANPAAQGGW